VTVGRSASDYLQVPPSDPDIDGAPESAMMHPIVSDFARELLARLDIARNRVAGEALHLDVVERITMDYRAAERPWLRLLP
jgi:hypothetical protein